MNQLQVIVHDLLGVAYIIDLGEPMTSAQFQCWLDDNGMRLLPFTAKPDGLVEGSAQKSTLRVTQFSFLGTLHRQ